MIDINAQIKDTPYRFLINKQKSRYLMIRKSYPSISVAALFAATIYLYSVISNGLSSQMCYYLILSIFYFSLGFMLIFLYMNEDVNKYILTKIDRQLSLTVHEKVEQLQRRFSISVWLLVIEAIILFVSFIAGVNVTLTLIPFLLILILIGTILVAYFLNKAINNFCLILE